MATTSEGIWTPDEAENMQIEDILDRMAGTVNTSVVNAKGHADDRASEAEDSAVLAANGYTDTKAAAAQAAAVNSAKTYTDTREAAVTTNLQQYAQQQDQAVTAAANTYADQQAADARWERGQIANGTDIDNFKTPGAYWVRSISVAESLLNWPLGANPGHIEVLNTSTNAVVQRVTGSTEAAHRIVQRVMNSVTAQTWGPWRQIWPAETSPVASNVAALEATATGAATREDRVARAVARRGGPIGTSGKGAVALRFDHHLDFFRTQVLPKLAERQLPFALVLNPENIGSGDDNATWTEITAWCRDNGGEVWNHGGDHRDATTDTELVEQIVGSLQTLEANLPGLPVEGWAPPGLADGGYRGAAPFKTVAQNSQTLAGRLITGNHAMVAGYTPGIYRPLRAENPVGAAHITIDKATAADMAAAFDAITPTGEGLALMLHPNYLDDAGYLTQATLTEILDDLAARRDSGQIEVLSYTGLWLADSTSTVRHSLLAPMPAAVSLASPYTTRVSFGRREHFLGGSRQLKATISSASGCTVQLQAAGSTLNASGSVTLPGGTHVALLPFTVPLDHTGWLDFSVTATAGSPTLQQLRAEVI